MKPSRRDFLRYSAAVGLGGAWAPPSATAAGPQIGLGPTAGNGTVRIAVVQQEGNPGRVEQNRTKALRFAGEALGKGADVVLFHEVLLTGYAENVRQLAESVDGPTTRAFQSLLKGSKSLVLYGLTEREGDRFYVACPVVGADGVVAHYRKTHLWWKAKGLRYEPGIYTPGDRLVTFELRGHKCGLMICYDGDFPETTRSYANLGCEMLFWMNNRGSRGYEEVRRLAQTNSIIMATSCCCGADENGNPCRGGSNITDARGRLLTEIWEKEGILYADVQPQEALHLRKENPWYRGQRGDLYYYPEKASPRQ